MGVSLNREKGECITQKLSIYVYGGLSLAFGHYARCSLRSIWHDRPAEVPMVVQQRRCIKFMVWTILSLRCLCLSDHNTSLPVGDYI